jgi:hypothetical protein
MEYIVGFISAFFVSIFIFYVIREVVRLLVHYVFIKGIKGYVLKDKKAKELPYKWFDIRDTILEQILIKIGIIKDITKVAK